MDGGGYGTFQNPGEEVPGPFRQFFVVLAGNTQEAHQPIVHLLLDQGQTQVWSHEEADYNLLFCPVVSRVGSDIDNALADLPSQKPVVLVVLHHTHNSQQQVQESRQQTDDDRVWLTVDCLHFKQQLHHCDPNSAMEGRIISFLQRPTREKHVTQNRDVPAEKQPGKQRTWVSRFKRWCTKWLSWKVVGMFALTVSAIWVCRATALKLQLPDQPELVNSTYRTC